MGNSTSTNSDANSGDDTTYTQINSNGRQTTVYPSPSSQANTTKRHSADEPSASLRQASYQQRRTESDSSCLPQTDDIFFMVDELKSYSEAREFAREFMNIQRRTSPSASSTPEQNTTRKTKKQQQWLDDAEFLSIPEIKLKGRNGMIIR